MIAVADLLARGFKPYLPVVNQRSHDIIAVSPAGAVVTFEVRSGRRDCGKLVYNGGSKTRSDHYAVVLAGEPVMYKPDLPD